MIIFVFGDIFLAFYLLLGPKYFTMNFNALPLPFAIFSAVPVPSGREEVTCLVAAPHPQKREARVTLTIQNPLVIPVSYST
jgi:hypothetical protein